MTDVVIIGGGIAGMSACAQLAPYVKVILLEAEPELCYHSSGRSAATFIEDYGNRVTKELNKASGAWNLKTHRYKITTKGTRCQE